MIPAKRFEKGFFACFVIAAVVLSGFNAAGAIEGELAGLFPADSFLYVIVPEGVTALQEKLKKTSLWGLYKDPAMQRFIESAEKVVREKLDEKLKEAWKELEIDEPPEELPWPTGRVVLAMRMGMKNSQVPEPVPQFVVIADMGESMPALKEIAANAAEKAVDEGAKRQREDVRGVQMETITPAVAESAEGEPSHRSPEPEPTCYAFTGETALLSNDGDMLRDVLARMGGAELDSLADNNQMQEVLQALGPGDVRAYLDVSSLINSIKRPQAEKVIRALGLDNVAGLGMVAQIVPSQMEELRIKGMLAVTEEKRGIIALLTPISGSTSGHRLLTKGLASFMVANYDPEKLFNQINEIVQAAGGPDINIALAQMMAVTGLNDPAGRPAVDFQQDIISQLNSPVTVLTRVDKPYSDPAASKTLVALGVRDAAVLETALGRVHETFIAQGNKELQRELLGSKIFLLPGDNPFGAMFSAMPRSSPAEQEDEPSGAFAIAGNNLVIGSVAGVEQAIRDLRRDDLQPIQADPLYSQAARYLPAQSGAWSYKNQQIDAELLWARLKEAARRDATDEPDESGSDGPEMRISGVWSMMFEELFEEFEEIDFGALPEFEAVKKYFGAYVDHMEETERGIYFESLLIKAQPRQ